MISIHTLKKSIIEAIFPTKCMACDAFFNPPEPAERVDEGDWRNALSDVACAECLKKVTPTRSPMCTVCGEVFISVEGDDHCCEKCIQDSRQFRKARAFGIYDTTLMMLIHRYKYEGKIQLVRPLGKLLFDAFLKFWKPDAIDLIVPVPLYKKRFRKRGFNQVFLMVRSWQEFYPAPSRETIPDLTANVLVRHHQTAPQTGLGRKERMTNIKNAFSIQDGSSLRDKSVLLTDDVYTTGATAEACARVLLHAGAGSVDVLTLARA